RDVVQGKRAIERLNGFVARQRRIIDDRDISLQTGRPQNCAPGKLGVFFKDLVNRGIEELEEMFTPFGLARAGGIRRRRRRVACRAGRRGGYLPGDIGVRSGVGSRVGGGRRRRKRGKRERVGVRSKGSGRLAGHHPRSCIRGRNGDVGGGRISGLNGGVGEARGRCVGGGAG